MLRIGISLALTTVVFFSADLRAIDKIQMATDPVVSPDGKSVAFSWNGDIWLTSIKGGSARPVTRHPAADGQPAFSPDGKAIAFTSTRTGTRQVHVVAATGSPPKRISSHTEGFSVLGWHPDGKSILTSITRDHFWRRGKRFSLLKLKDRGVETILFDDYGANGRLSPDGKKLLFTREGERDWRKGYKGSRATQIWLYDLEKKTFKKLVHEEEESRSPIWKPDGKAYYYVAERGGVGNLRLRELASGEETQLTQFKEDSVMYPSISKDGSVIVFRNLFDLYSLKPDGESKPTKLEIRNAADHALIREQRRTLKSATQVAFSKDGLEIAFIAGGDLWVMDTELREPVQVTSTPAFERDPVFTADGRSILFVGERSGQPDIWHVGKADEKLYWWQNAKFKFTQLTKDSAAEANLRLSPNGSQLAYTKDRGDLWVMRPDGKDARLVFESWNAPQFNWSPDSKWLVYAQSDNDFNRDIWIRPLDDSRKPFNLSRHPDNDSNPVWSPNGRIVAFTGRRRADETDIYFAWLTEEDDQTGTRDFKLKKAIEKMKKGRSRSGSARSRTASPATKTSPSKTPPAKPADDDHPAKKKATPQPGKPATAKSATKRPSLKIDFADLHKRLHRVSIPNTSEGSILWSPDSKKLAFTARVDGKFGTYYIEIPTSLKPKLLNAKTGSQVHWISSGNRILWLSSGVPGSVVGTSVSTYSFSAKQRVNIGRTFAEAFNQSWRAMRDNFYDNKLGNRDWNKIREKYADMAANSPDGSTLGEVINLMLGELNGSHLGFYYRGPALAPVSPPDSWSDTTAHLGVRFDPRHQGPGLLVRDVIPEGPADQKRSQIAAGEVITAIDGKKVSPTTHLTPILTGKPEREISLEVRESKKKKARTRTVVLRPTSYSRIRSLLYEEWISDNQARVAAASDDSLAYVHIAGMNMTSFHRFEEELFSAASGKDGIVIDVRENGGGSTTDHLLTILTQPRHAITIPRGGGRGYPQDRKIYASWHKPIVVLCNQNSYSNAEIFSHAIRHLKRGKVIGVPTAGGVISTGRKTIMDVGYIRMPFRGWYRLSDGQDMELHPAQPHYVVWPLPGELPSGKDTQLQKAIQVLKKEVKKYQRLPELKLIKASERKK